MSRIFICSLKYHPGLFKEIELLLNKFNNNFPTSAVMSRGYLNQLNKDCSVKLLNDGRGTKGMLRDIFLFPFHFINFYKFVNKVKKRKLFIFYNPHPLNFLYSFFINLLISDSMVCTVLHEPHKSHKEKKIYGFFKFIYFYIVEIVQNFSVNFSEIIITMSPNGAELFKNKFPKYKGLHIESNLLINSPEVNIEKKIPRSYFSYIGTVNKGKGIYEFIDLVNYSLKMNDDMKFCIITSSKIDEYLPLFDDNYLSKLTVINKKNIGDDEIEKVIFQSLAVFSIHNVAAQSGVLPLAYSLLTPSIMRNLAAFTQFKTDDNLILSTDFDTKEIYNVCDLILKNKTNFSKYQLKCQLTFDRYFSEQNFELYYNELINKL